VHWICLTELFSGLEQRELPLGLVLVGAGLIYMIIGARAARLLTVLSYVVLGFALGRWLPIEPVLQGLVGLVAAVGFGWFSRSYHRLSVGILAGAWAGWCLVNVAFYAGLPDPVVWAVGGGAFVGIVSLAYVLLREVTAAVLSFQGSVVLVAGMVVFISSHAQLWTYLRVIFVKYPPYLAFLLLAGTVIGFYLQMAEERRRELGTSV